MDHQACARYALGGRHLGAVEVWLTSSRKMVSVRREHITYTQAPPVKATSVAHCLGNRTPHVTHPRFPPPPSRRPRPPWRSCECRTRSARLHKLAGAASAQPLRTTVAAAAAALAVAAAAAVALRRLCLARPLRTHHLACTPAAIAAAATTTAAAAASHLLSCRPSQRTKSSRCCTSRPSCSRSCCSARSLSLRRRRRLRLRE